MDGCRDSMAVADLGKNPSLVVDMAWSPNEVMRQIGMLSSNLLPEVLDSGVEEANSRIQLVNYTFLRVMRQLDGASTDKLDYFVIYE